ncbi:hypothetical protein COW77_01725 [Candidatus Wolfebacteria bacterium CG18_big_fil_WC_8_21_14_2_50_39_7]|uniref:Uncharacterized protein n=4 Tax=Candidatus Wolfeibacteriota TaxID=1752735 RepID=A0A2M7Q7L2_9BACT|nr:MAG: hypothetical protein AUJ30_01185 [Candidatus Wolfebacteria bacterium CG1_02_39_135]PIP92118.1 MAG: hypothetical protein COW77_01725 [Candidatus Wolfebacteria bacterium CG18_big_fil_WC_8_21_14_2_50_39_7]PIY59102.1 MAG: hypothetical protein COY97_00660 [Candidatus Wolfebacteria bacterium CG_4_10_14_0_8_um_filter_39_64]PJB83331.1 MAG: hypothetical protein CO087_01945 [Candidatus Wolfebacteria bacterium CG_4_9_14_0_8_um_filter_39_46]
MPSVAGHFWFVYVKINLSTPATRRRFWKLANKKLGQQTKHFNIFENVGIKSFYEYIYFFLGNCFRSGSNLAGNEKKSGRLS